MRAPVRSLAASPILCLAAGLWSEAPGIDVVTDPACFREAVGPLTRIDFEDLPADARSCSISNPLVIEGVTFSDPHCLSSGFCGGCDPDREDNEGDMVLMMNPGGAIDLPAGATGILLETLGMGSNPFTLRAIDTDGGTSEARGWRGILHDGRRIGFISSRGLARIEVVGTGGTGGLVAFAAVELGMGGKPLACGFLERRWERLEPAATGTVRFLPEMALRQMAGSDVQSTYFRTTPQNREFRRGLMEFDVPAFSGGIETAVLVLSANGGVVTSAVRPPVLHDVHDYEADLRIGVEDYERAASSLASLETRSHIGHETFVIEVHDLIREFRGRSLGFRIQLGVDPGFAEFESIGTGFTAWIEVELTAAFTRGDADGNGITDITDAIAVLEFLFLRPGGLSCLRAADTDDSGRLDISDPIALLLHLFSGGLPPRAPFPDCGGDRTPDDLGCSSSSCP